MCPLGEIASCQLSFVPIQSENYLNDIELVLEQIKASNLEYDIGEMSTIIKGSKTQLMELISCIYDQMSVKCSFVMDIKLSNICGCCRNL